jgi:hypothetical protein
MPRDGWLAVWRPAERRFASRRQGDWGLSRPAGAEYAPHRRLAGPRAGELGTRHGVGPSSAAPSRMASTGRAGIDAWLAGRPWRSRLLLWMRCRRRATSTTASPTRGAETSARWPMLCSPGAVRIVAWRSGSASTRPDRPRAGFNRRMALRPPIGAFSKKLEPLLDRRSEARPNPSDRKGPAFRGLFE